MVNNKKAKSKGVRLYPLAEVGVRFQIHPDELHRSAAEGKVELCILVPPGYRVYNVDPASLQIPNPAYLLPLSQFDHQYPSQEYGMPVCSRVPIQAVTVSRLACKESLLIPVPDGISPPLRPCSSQSLFSHGFSTEEEIAVGCEATFEVIRPVRPREEFDPKHKDAEQWCLAVYPDDIKFERGNRSFQFKGYEAPIEFVISHKNLWVSDLELQKIVPAKDVAIGKYASEKPLESKEKKEVPAVKELSIADQGSLPAVNLTPDASPSHYDAAVMEYSQPLKLLSMKALTDKIGLSKATVHNKLDEKGKYYDPTFPKGIKTSVGRVGYLESEIDFWIINSRDRVKDKNK